MNDPTESGSRLQDLMGFLSSVGGKSTGQEVEETHVEYLQVIGLELAGENFTIDILNVREIVRLEELEISRVPHAHSYVLGVINLRGKVVPVIDLGARLGLKAKKRDRRARLVVVEIGDQVVGFTADAVSEVLHLPRDQIESAAAAEEWVVGVAMVQGEIMTLLDLEKLLVAQAGKRRN